MSENWSLGFIGAGVMAETMLSGALGKGLLPKESIFASDPNKQRRDLLSQDYGVRTFEDNLEVLQRSDLVVLGVKPQSLPRLLPTLKGAVPESLQILSIVAGASIESLRQAMKHPRVARAMPNLPCRIHCGTTVWTGAEGEDGDRIRSVLACMGDAIEVDHEQHIDRATAVNGTGPAIIAEFVKAFMEAATYIGEPRDLARASVLSTLKGTVEMIAQSEDHVAQVIDQVTSPGGTTSRALQVLKKGRLAAVVTDSVDAAYQRTLELGREVSNE